MDHCFTSFFFSFEICLNLMKPLRTFSIYLLESHENKMLSTNNDACIFSWECCMLEDEKTVTRCFPGGWIHLLREARKS